MGKFLFWRHEAQLYFKDDHEDLLTLSEDKQAKVAKTSW